MSCHVEWVTYLFLNLPQFCMLIAKKKNNIFFHYIQILKFSVKIKIFLDILIVSIMYEPGKVEKVLGNKIGITIYSWTLCKRFICRPNKNLKRYRKKNNKFSFTFQKGTFCFHHISLWSHSKKTTSSFWIPKCAIFGLNVPFSDKYAIFG